MDSLLFLSLVSIAIIILIHPFSGHIYLDTLSSFGNEKNARDLLQILLSTEVEDHMTVEDCIIRELVYGEQINASAIINQTARSLLKGMHYSFSAIYHPAPGNERRLHSGEFTKDYMANEFIFTPIDISEFSEVESRIISEISENITPLLERGNISDGEMEIILRPHLQKMNDELCRSLNLTDCPLDFTPLLSAIRETHDPSYIGRFIRSEYRPGIIEVRFSVWR